MKIDNFIAQEKIKAIIRLNKGDKKMNKKTSEFAGRMSDAAAVAIFLIAMFGAPVYGLFQKFGNVIKRKAQLINGGMER